MNTPRNGSITSVVLPLLAAAALLLPSLAVAQTDVLYVVNDKVGIGTGSPAEKLHILGGAGADLVLQLQGPGGKHVENRYFDGASQLAGRFLAATGNDAGSRYFGFISYFDKDGYAMPVRFFTHNAVGTFQEVLFLGAGQAAGEPPRVGIGVGFPTHPLQLANGAYCDATGHWIDASSRAYKQDIRDLTVAEAEKTLAELNPVRYAAKADPSKHHVGFIAEDVPDLVATPDRNGLAPMDIVAVLTKVVQEQQRTIDELKARVDSMERNKQQ